MSNPVLKSLAPKPGDMTPPQFGSAVHTERRSCDAAVVAFAFCCLATWRKGPNHNQKKCNKMTNSKTNVFPANIDGFAILVAPVADFQQLYQRVYILFDIIVGNLQQVQQDLQNRYYLHEKR
jgi:hypothetical protein